MDCPGSERSHGYTHDGQEGWTWYWVLDHRTGEVSFRDAGTPVAQPSEPPERVREATEQWVERHADERGPA